MALTQVQSSMLSGSTNSTTTIQSNGTTAITIDSSQNVGVGTTSPSNKLEVVGTIAAKIGSGDVQFSAITGGANYATYQLQNSTNRYSMQIRTDQSNAWVLRDETAGANRMIVDTSGRLYLNQAGQSGNTAQRAGMTFNGSVEWGLNITTSSNSGNAVNFTNASGTQIGQIQVSGSSTGYVTSSDYRLKENIQPITGALNKVNQLKPCTYDWISDKSKGQGFIAHELQAIVPDCVFGEKDAVDAEGKPVYQGIDTSFLVATLTAAIQELKAEVDSLKAQLAK